MERSGSPKLSRAGSRRNSGSGDPDRRDPNESSTDAARPVRVFEGAFGQAAHALACVARVLGVQAGGAERGREPAV
eukprot:3640079-Rhodomonas_salina.1